MEICQNLPLFILSVASSPLAALIVMTRFITEENPRGMGILI
jgi:hypothetical protein